MSNMNYTEAVLNLKQIKRIAKDCFKDCDLLLNGFAIDCVNVRVRKRTITISNFFLDGSLTEADFLFPTSKADLLKKLIHHCGREKIEAQLKSTVSFV
jgi:hypothetical protein